MSIDKGKSIKPNRTELPDPSEDVSRYNKKHTDDKNMPPDDSSDKVTEGIPLDTKEKIKIQSAQADADKKDKENEKIDKENIKLGEEIKTIIENRGLRRGYANKTFLLIVAWLLILFATLLANRWTWNISDSVLITLITTTTANVLGIFYFVMKYLFSEKN